MYSPLHKKQGEAAAPPCKVPATGGNFQNRSTVGVGPGSGRGAGAERASHSVTPNVAHKSSSTKTAKVRFFIRSLPLHRKIQAGAHGGVGAYLAVGHGNVRRVHGIAL